MSLTLHHCADCRNAALAKSLANAESYTRVGASPNEVPPTQAYKMALVEILGDTSGIIDCRDVYPTAKGAHAIWMANEIAGFALREEGRPAIMKWLGEAAVRRFHNLDPQGHLVRPYGYTPRTYNAIIEMLSSDPESKRCVVSFQEPSFIEPALETPCAISTQYLVRAGFLWTINVYRSHDFFAGVRTDPIRISAVQQAIARDLGVMPGPIVFEEGSLHYYPTRKHQALDEIASYSCQGSPVSPRFEVGGVSQAGHAVRDLLQFAEAFQRGPIQQERIDNPTLELVLENARAMHRALFAASAPASPVSGTGA